MNNEIPLNLISSNRDLCDVLWVCDESEVTLDYSKTMTIPVDTNRYKVFCVIIRDSITTPECYYTMIVNDPSIEYEYIVGYDKVFFQYRTVKIVNEGLMFGDVYLQGSVYNPPNINWVSVIPHIIYGIR